MFETEVIVLLAAAAGAVSGNLLSWVVRRIDGFVRGTSNKIDDEIWFTVREAMADALGYTDGEDDDEGDLPSGL